MIMYIVNYIGVYRAGYYFRTFCIILVIIIHVTIILTKLKRMCKHMSFLH